MSLGGKTLACTELVGLTLLGLSTQVMSNSPSYTYSRVIEPMATLVQNQTINWPCHHSSWRHHTTPTLLLHYAREVRSKKHTTRMIKLHRNSWAMELNHTEIEPLTNTQFRNSPEFATYPFKSCNDVVLMTQGYTQVDVIVELESSINRVVQGRKWNFEKG